ncbi:alpha/beta hydrolase family protein [Nocardia concava]|uniref:alpha/beta hydrolase family protein n=1 Tax=Nocardia concava TaxID=257281 RepID=UPI0002DE62C8|nr:alpha/beta hydrolase [Nocardia concava]
MKIQPTAGAARLLLPCALVALLLALLITPAAPATATPDITEQEVTFTGGGGLTLHGTVIKPSATHSDTPGIVLVGGSGPGPRQEYRREAEAFAAMGLTVLAYDKRTDGYSRIHRDFDLLAADALAAVHVLRETPRVRPDLVGLWGFSEGGWVAPLAASRSTDVAFLITLGAPGFTPLRTQTWSLANQLRHQGDTGPLANTLSGPAARLLDSTGLFAAADFDPLPALRTLRIPILALWGQHDVQTPPAESATVLRTTLSADPSVTIRFLDSSHNARATTDGFDRIGAQYESPVPRGDFAPRYLDTMSAWLRQVADGNPPASSAEEPPAQEATSRDPGHGWWTAPGVQAVELVAIILSFTAYLAISFANKGIRQVTTARRGPRLLAATGLFTTLATIVYVLSIYATNTHTLGPIILDRPLPWLVLQLLALATTVLLATTTTTLLRHRATLPTPHRAALTALTCTGFIWLAWALTWSLLAR